ncbi:MAG: DUF3253 domain-containing protein [Oscillochloridaceae bacterium]|nr:DUF3253 domain-containing protein [Chloroflexaceae bacterium]MDW8391382.1 DUF3253 domain-containing protein [Oscillochloridaceae bacterium]
MQSFSPDEYAVLQALARLQPGATACPGAVSRALRPAVPTPERMAWMRAVCAALCERGLLRITQRGVAVGCTGYRGPIRVALTPAGRAALGLSDEV